MKKSLFGLLLASTLVAACGTASPDAGGEPSPETEGLPEGVDPEETTGSFHQAVQSNAATHFQFDLVNFKQTASAFLLIPQNPELTLFASCGATFISKHFAVTAAHCVGQRKVPFNRVAFLVNNVNIDVLAWRIALGDSALAAKFSKAQTVTGGDFPNWGTAATLNASDGYGYTEPGSLGCGVVVRCSRAHGQENCPDAVKNLGGGEGADIALVYCPGRPEGRPWTRVYEGDDVTGMDVEVHWTHEVLRLSMEPNDGIGLPNNFASYGAYDPSVDPDGAKARNWHYAGALSHQWMPLVSRKFPNGITYKSTSRFFKSGDTERYTDLFACHGTSGGGVFPQASDRVMGPAISGNETWSDRLCTRPGLLAPGTHNMSFVRPFITRQLEAMVVNDR